MKTNFVVCLISLSLLMTSCISNDIPITTTPTLPPSTFLSPTSSPSPNPPTDTPIPITFVTRQPTLEPDQAKQAIQSLLQENIDCTAPCFWGIVPGQTTLDDAKIKLSRLRIPLQYVTRLENKDYYQFTYEFDNGLSFSPNVMVQNGIVKNIRVSITPETQTRGVSRAWLAYSPEMLIARYGAPSRVEIVVDTGPRTFFAISLYFDAFDLIVQYAGYGIIKSDIRICPLAEQYDAIGILFGMNPENPPRAAIPLEEATSLTIEEFSELMLGDPENACFNLTDQAFP